MNDTDEKPLSEGEQIIEQFFIDKDIKYQCQVKLPNLKNDTKAYREADFYLPKFRIYVEFFGQWNLPDQRPRYREKKQVYLSNKVPCIYLYPENLGFLEQAIHMRIEKELKEQGMRKELVKFKHYQLGAIFDQIMITFMIISSFLFLWMTRNNMAEWAVNGRIVIVVLLLVACGWLFVGILMGIFEYLRIWLGWGKMR